jgi:AcrR family transcriptional regulator
MATRSLDAMSSQNGAKAAALGGLPAQERALRPQGRKTMQRLLDAGRQVFEKHGFHAARVDDIVKTAKTSHGTFYLYFANKEDLFKALALDAMGQMETLGSRLGPIAPDDAGRQVLRQWVGEFVDIYAAHGTVIRAWTDREFAARDLGQRAQSSLLALSGALSARIDEARGGLGDDATIEGVACLSMLERFNYFQQSQQVRFNREDTIDVLTRAVFEGFFVPTKSTAPRRSRIRRGGGSSTPA